jgi:hypothetical protein
MAIMFVGDEPSKKNKDPKVPFVGTKSYLTLLTWIYRMDLDVSDLILRNSTPRDMEILKVKFEFKSRRMWKFKMRNTEVF